MSLEKIFSVLILGLSPDRLLLCPFLAMSLSLANRWSGLQFVLGRLLGVSLLGAVISAVGISFYIPPNIIDGVFGVFLLVLGLNVFLRTKHNVNPKPSFNAGFGLGLFRGLLNPGRKIAYLVPLLWGVKITEGIAISFVYALSSSIYLLVGFFSADILNKLTAYQKKIKVAGGISLLILGFFYVLKALGGGYIWPLR